MISSSSRKNTNNTTSVLFAALVAAAAAASYVVAFAATPACDDGAPRSEPPKTDPTTLVSSAGSFTRGSLLTQIGQCAFEGYRRGSEKAASLAKALQAYEAEQTPASKAAAQAAFAETMVEYQRIEPMQFGPFASNVSPGGEGVRDLVYAWPNSNRCLVDEALVAKGYEGADFSTKGPVSARGLAAAEYLLFNDATATNACRETSVINAQAQWAPLASDAAELARRRAKYARIVVEDVNTRLAALVQRWDSAGGNFLNEVTTAGAGSRYYGSQQLALNSIMDGLFYVDIEVKDSKIGRPLGVIGGCVGDCANETEAPYSKLGRAHLMANLAGFRAIFYGCGAANAGLGFDDLLEGLGASRVATSMTSTLAEVDAAVAAIPDGKLEDELRAKSAAASTLHAALRKLGTLLKTEVVTVLNLELPARVEGDND